MSSFAYTTPPPPPRPKTPFTHVVYLYNGIQLSKGHLGSRGGKHAQKEYCKVLETKGIYILNNLVLLLLLFENL